MNARTRKMAIAAAALAAAGLLGSLPFDGSSVAQSGVPIEHHDVALVDIDTTILTDETSLDNALYSDVFGSSGVESSLFNYTDTLLGGGATGLAGADLVLGTTTGADGIFDGAASSFSSGVLLDAWAGEDELNQLLGISATTSETAILADIAGDPDISLAGDTLPTVGTAGFDTDLMTIATADYAAATSEFTTYLDSLPTILGDLGGGDLTGLLGTLLGDLGLGGLLGGL